MKIKLLKLTLILTGITSIIISCGNIRSENQKAPVTTTLKTTDTSYTGVIKAIWWDNGFGAGMISFYQGPTDIELWVKTQDGELALNPEVRDIFKWTGSGRNPDSKYLNKKVKVTYWKAAPPGEPQRRNIKTIEVLGEEIPKFPVKTMTGFITEVTTKDSTCITLQTNFDDPQVDIVRMYVDETNLLKVNVDAIKDIFTYKNYSAQLNPKYQGKKIKITCEPKILTNRSVYNRQTRTDKFYGYAITAIEPVK
jgi:hypothetical protein